MKDSVSSSTSCGAAKCQECFYSFASALTPFLPVLGFTSAITMVLYIPPQANTAIALSELHDVLSAFQNKDPGAAFIIAEDFNKASHLEAVLTRYIQTGLQSCLTSIFWITLLSLSPSINKSYVGMTQSQGRCNGGPPNQKLRYRMLDDVDLNMFQSCMHINRFEYHLASLTC